MGSVAYQQSAGVAHIRIQPSAGGTVFDDDTRLELHRALHQYRRDAEALIAVISVEGRDFCPPQEVAGRAPAPGSPWAGGYVEVWKPVIAAVNGACDGEGLALALSCDLRVAEEGATFSASARRLGAAADTVAIWLMNLAGLTVTFDLLWTERALTATEAQEMGLINRIVEAGEPDIDPGEGRFPMLPLEGTLRTPDGDVVAAALEWAANLLRYAPVTRAFQKETAYRSIGVPFHYAQSLELGPDPYTSEDRAEGVRAFVEQRRPVWRNR